MRLSLRTASRLTFAAALLFCTARFGAAEVNELTKDEKAAGWKLLFDGKSLAGWDVAGNREGWAVEDDAIACMVKNGGYIYTKEQWADFILDCEFRTGPRVNSGIFLRWEDLKDPVNSGMEIQVLDSFGRVKPETHDCGALYDCVAPSVDAVKPAGEWNHMTITCRGPIMRIVLNGQQIIETDLSAWTTPGMNPDGTPNKFKRAYSTMLQKGYIGFQDHGGRVWYRNIKLKELPPWQVPVKG
jgi:hypothetical protein